MNAPFTRHAVNATSPSETMLPPLSARREVKKAVILAAGRGRRMGKLTSDRPKGALEVGGHALIDWQIEALRAAGVSDIAIVTGHGAEALAGRDVTYIHNADWKTGTQVETLLKAATWVGDEPTLVSYSDIIFHPSAPLALLERAGEIVIAYDADHRWLWQERFGNWLKDSETFRLGPGQVLAEIGSKPTDIEELDGQFMGLLLFEPPGLHALARHYAAADGDVRQKLDFTALLQILIGAGVRIDTAANVLPWVEVDSLRDLMLAQTMVQPDKRRGLAPKLEFPSSNCPSGQNGSAKNRQARDSNKHLPIRQPSQTSNTRANTDTNIQCPVSEAYTLTTAEQYSVNGAFAVQNWGRSGSTYLQSLLDDHPNILATPNFYSRHFYQAWAKSLALVPDDEKVEAFLNIFRQWWDTGLVDASASLHRLGPKQSEIATVNYQRLEHLLRTQLPTGRPITRRSLFEAAHLAYARSRDQRINHSNLQILFPIHGQSRGVAAAFLEDYPTARFIHTVREPLSNLASTIRYYRFHKLDASIDTMEASLDSLFLRSSRRDGQTITLFGDRAYFGWCAAHGQACALRLEDLRAHLDQTMRSICDWLDIPFQQTLLRSTWNGKECGDRPDTARLPRDSRTVAPDSPLSEFDERRVESFIMGCPSIAAAYRDGSGRVGWFGMIGSVAASVVPWRAERGLRPAAYRSLAGLLRTESLLPKSTRATAWNQLIRERIRNQLLQFNSGSEYIRRKIQDHRKPGTIRATIMLRPNGDEWKIKALVSVNEEDRAGNDTLSVLFTDSPSPGSAAYHFFWVAALTFGFWVDRTTTYIRVRRKMISLIAHNSRSLHEPLMIIK